MMKGDPIKLGKIEHEGESICVYAEFQGLEVLISLRDKEGKTIYKKYSQDPIDYARARLTEAAAYKAWRKTNEPART